MVDTAVLAVCLPTCLVFTDLGDRTRVDHELEMIPKGVFKLMAPMMKRTGRMNLRATADALKRYLRNGLRRAV